MWWARWIYSVPPASYDGRIYFNLDKLHRPTNETEIVSLVQKAYKDGGKIRVIGDGHSWSEIAQTQDIMISLVDYTGLVGVDRDKMTATFKAGTSLSDISQVLEKEGLAMINLGSVAGQSIAGAISTGTHGTGITVGNLASLVVGLRIVSGDDGKVVSVSVSDKASTDLLKAAQVSIGMFGVLSEVTVKVTKKFHLKEERTFHSLDYCMNHLDELVNGEHTFVKMWVELHNSHCVLFQTHKTNENIKSVPYWMSFLTYYSFAITTRITYLLPFMTQFMMNLVGYVGFYFSCTRVDISYNIFNDHFDLPIHQEGEVIVHYNDTGAALRAIQDVVIKNNLPVNYMTEVRWVKGDDIFLSPQYGLDPGTCAITLTIYAPEYRAMDYFKRAYQATEKYGARFHWGKHFHHDREEITDLYPRLKTFATLRKRMDPKNIFVNEFLEERFRFASMKPKDKASAE